MMNVMFVVGAVVAFNPSVPALGPRTRQASIGSRPDVLTMSGRPETTSVLDQYNSRRQFLQISAAAAAALSAASPVLAKPKNSVLFTNVKDGETVPSTFTYKFDVTGYTVSPAKDGLIDGTGHHHLIVDGDGSFFPNGEAIPMDATHKHYGKGQSEGELALEPGKHKITLQFANALHQSYGKEFAKTITVNVKDS
jgi:hypothetical protein